MVFKKGNKYKRDISDFRWLCLSCHSKEHNRENNIKTIREIKEINKKNIIQQNEI